MSHSHVQKRDRGKVLIGVVVAAVVALVVVLFTVSSPSDDVAEPVRAPAPQEQPSTSPTPAPEQDVVIEQTRTMPFTPVWNPPDSGQDFWQIVDPGEGYPEDGGTDYLLAHACRDGGCAGDEIRTLQPDDTFSYEGSDYVVDEKLQIDKTEIADQDIWEHEDGRLVVITCILDRATGEYRQNDIIVAHLDA